MDNAGMVAILLAMMVEAGPAQAAPSKLAIELQAKDQALLDAVATGDRATWERTLTPDATYVDENGATLTRGALLADLNPLPPGVSGQIHIVEYKVKQIGDTALVIHRDDERETFHGQALTATYLTTETWVRQQGQWKLALAHVYVVNRDPASIDLPTAVLDEYVGRYAAAPDLVWVIARDGDHLVGGREGQPAKPLRVEMRDILFVPGAPRSRKLFQRDEQGRVTGFIDRREGQDLRWTHLRWTRVR
jgi:ketosteroid isomerase-like protein